jgi:hypothetical protein
LRNKPMRIFTAGLILFIVIGVTLILCPAKLEAASLALTTWQLFFADEFNTSDDLGDWNSDPGDGSFRVDTASGFLHLESNWGYTYPMVWRNDLFSQINVDNLDYAIEVRFRRPSLAAYGSAFGVGTANFSGTRFSAGDPYPPNNYENVLTNEQHQPLGQFSGHERICMHQPGKPLPVDYSWHVGRAEFIGGTGFHYFDASLIGTASCYPRPVSIYFGNSYIQSFIGSWSTLDVDYIRIYVPKMAAPNSLIYLPFILK